MKKRSPRIVQDTEEAFLKYRHILLPEVYYREFFLKRSENELILSSTNAADKGKYILSDKTLYENLHKAQKIIALICTIGSKFDTLMEQIPPENLMESILLDSIGTSAVEMLGIQSYRYFEKVAASEKIKITQPLSPGMQGWSVNKGQEELFALFKNTALRVALNEHQVMVPLKSLSMLIGAGAHVKKGRSVCETCPARFDCLYQSCHNAA